MIVLSSRQHFMIKKKKKAKYTNSIKIPAHIEELYLKYRSS